MTDLLTMEVEIGNFKSALNETVMKVIQRPLGSDDIVYTSLLVTMSAGVPLYQATVRINALEGREFDGHPKGLRKSSEQSAAQVALSQITSALGGKMGSVTPSMVRGQQVAKLPNYKGRLQELLVQERMKARFFGVRGSECGPVELSYSTTNVPPEIGRPSTSRFRAQVTITSTSYQADFVGDVCRERKTAEQSAAHVALQHFIKQDSLAGGDKMLDASTLAVGGPVGDRAPLPAPSAKSELNEFVMKILSRPATAQDIVYGLKSASANSPFKACVAVPSLAPGLEFEGEAHAQKKAAEQSAASEALKHFKSLPNVPRPAPGASASAPTTLPIGWSALGGETGPDGEPLPPGVRALARRKPMAAENIESKNGNHKSALNEFVMKLAGRPLTAGDILYAVRSSRPGQFQATAKVPVIDDMEFQAAPRARKRDAEQCAAQIALLYYQAKYPGGGGVPNAEGGLSHGPGGADDGREFDPANFKSALNELTMKTAGRPLAPGDITYHVLAVGIGQYQASVKPFAIDPVLEILGDVATKKKDAEQLAAAKALEIFGANPPTAVASPHRGVVNMAGGLDPTLASTDIGNFKSALNELVMRSCGRPLARNDIAYVPRPCGNGQFLCAVKVLALDPDHEFEGEVRARKKGCSTVFCQGCPPPLSKPRKCRCVCVGTAFVDATFNGAALHGASCAARPHKLRVMMGTL